MGWTGTNPLPSPAEKPRSNFTEKPSMRLLNRPRNNDVVIHEPQRIALQTPKKDRRGGIIVILLFALFALVLVMNWESETPEQNGYQPVTVTNPTMSDYVLSQPDRVAVEGERLRLAAEKERIETQLAEMEARRREADSQQQTALLWQTQQLEIDGRAVDLQIREWDALRARQLADAEAEATAERLQAEARATADKMRAEATALLAWAEAEARLVQGVAVGLGIMSAAMLTGLGILAAVLMVDYARNRPAPEPRPALPDPPPRREDKTDEAMRELHNLMREIERHGRESTAVDSSPPEVSPDVQYADMEKILPSSTLTDRQKEWILSKYHQHKGGLRPAGRECFTSANGRTDKIIKKVVEESERVGR